MITNPDALFVSKIEMDEFIQEIKDFVKTVIGEEVKYVENTNNRAD